MEEIRIIDKHNEKRKLRSAIGFMLSVSDLIPLK